MLAIHLSSSGFSEDWVSYCKLNSIPYKIVNCYQSDIIQQLEGCDALLWHHHHSNAKDVLFAKQLLFSLEQAGFLVFPNFKTGWHFDDKVGQKYLLESIGAPLVKSYVFYDADQARQWIGQSSFPKVFKLRGGAGSNNVRLIKSKNKGHQLIATAFGKGFSNYNRWGDFNENLRKVWETKGSYLSLLKSIIRLFISTKFARVKGREKGYIYFQDFVPNNNFDIRVVVIGERAFAIKRIVRKNDFRASGSGTILYEKSEIDERCVQIAFEVNEKIDAQVIAYDFVFDENKPLIVEVNYGYAHKSYFDCPGYWNKDMTWHVGKFNSAHWIIEDIIAKNNR